MIRTDCATTENASHGVSQAPSAVRAESAETAGFAAGWLDQPAVPGIEARGSLRKIDRDHGQYRGTPDFGALRATCIPRAATAGEGVPCRIHTGGCSPNTIAKYLKTVDLFRSINRASNFKPVSEKAGQVQVVPF